MMYKYIHNDADHVIFVSGVMVLPKDGAMVLVPDEAPETPVAAPQEPTLADQVAQLLQAPVKELVASLGTMTDDALQMMNALEQGAEKPRSSLLTALGDEILKRANDALKSDTL